MCSSSTATARLMPRERPSPRRRRAGSGAGGARGLRMAPERRSVGSRAATEARPRGPRTAWVSRGSLVVQRGTLLALSWHGSFLGP
eukprot:scaffold64697_cov42-Phaeocystis_antarctica.AAC.1